MTPAPPDRTGLDEARFAAELRAFLAEHHPGRAPRDPGERLEWNGRRVWACRSRHPSGRPDE